MLVAVGTRVFLSHSSRDKEEGQRLCRALANLGVDAWEDVLELRTGDSLDALRAAIRAARAFVVYLTPASISSEWVQREIAWALEAKAANPGYLILPVVRAPLGRPALKLLFGVTDVVSILLAEDGPIDGAVLPIAQALGVAPRNVVPRRAP